MPIRQQPSRPPRGALGTVAIRPRVVEGPGHPIALPFLRHPIGHLPFILTQSENRSRTPAPSSCMSLFYPPGTSHQSASVDWRREPEGCLFERAGLDPASINKPSSDTPACPPLLVTDYLSYHGRALQVHRPNQAWSGGASICRLAAICVLGPYAGSGAGSWSLGGPRPVLPAGSQLLT
jgi:hypothetical protein